MGDIWFEIPELLPRVKHVVPDADVKATYSAGPSHEDQSGNPAELWIGVANSSLNEAGVKQMAPVAGQVAALGLSWLGASNLGHPETVVTVMFADASEGRVFSSFNALETFHFAIDAAGELSAVPSMMSPADEASFRAMRYRMSGRKPPP